MAILLPNFLEKQTSLGWSKCYKNHWQYLPFSITLQAGDPNFIGNLISLRWTKMVAFAFSKFLFGISK
ncbi:MAG: hypothetical protein ABI378_01525 [Chitinophagaceae bacterium]